MIYIDAEACKACGICGHVCPRHVIETIEENGRKRTVVVEERLDVCMECGQCVAVCPNEAVRLEALAFEEFRPLAPVELTGDQFLALLEHRRSVRRYKDKPVPREVLDRALEAARLSPTGTGRPATGVLVINRAEKLEALSGLLYSFYENLERALANPVGRFIVKRRAGARMFRMLQDFVMPGMRWYIKWRREGRSDEIRRDCPVLVLFHCLESEPSGEEVCVIAAFNTILAAEVLGLGTCFNSLIPQACNRSPEIKAFLGLPQDRGVYASITLGYPQYKYQRGVPRRLAEVRYL
ncbi:MAG: nitroreductase family protein [Thermodesulfobacteriota bacterium]